MKEKDFCSLYLFYFILLNSHTLTLLSRVVSNHICPSFPPARQIQRVCSKSRRKQTADLKSTRLPNLLQILTHYASFAARYISTAQSEECFSVAFIFSWHHLSPIEKPFHRRTNPYGQKKAGKKERTRTHGVTHRGIQSPKQRRKKSPYLYFAAIPSILFSRLGEVCKYPWV